MLGFWKRGTNGKTVLYEEKPEFEDMELTSENIKKVIGASNDVIIREIYINNERELPVTLIFVEGLIDSKTLDNNILKPLIQESSLSTSKDETELIERICHGTLYHTLQNTRDNIDNCIHDILSGSVALVFDKSNKAITFDIKGFEKRSLDEPSAENVIKGSKDSFIEVHRINTALVRRRIRSPYLRVVETVVGVQTLTPVAVIYIEGIANEKIVTEVLKRLNSIKVDGAIVAGNIEEYIIDQKYSVFPQMLYTERPDRFCHNLLDGRIGIIVDGLPITYVVPSVLSQFMQAPEDYAVNYFMGTIIRFVRYISLFISLLLPGFYVAVSTFHQELIPSELAVAIVSSKEGVPFPAFIEIALMLFAFEILLEAGLRLPKSIGQALSIVGALVLGQAAVEARMVSPVVVILIAMTGIAGFTMPHQDLANALRVWRFILVAFSFLGGLFGMTFGLIILIHHLSTIEILGVPYFTPYAANDGKEIVEDTIFRFPMWSFKKRPSSLKTTNKKRQK